MPKRRLYSAEFKRAAVVLPDQPGVTKAQISRELYVNPNMITRWQREMTANGSKAFLGKRVARNEELATLKRENNRIQARCRFDVPESFDRRLCIRRLVFDEGNRPDWLVAA